MRKLSLEEVKKPVLRDREGSSDLIPFQSVFIKSHLEGATMYCQVVLPTLRTKNKVIGQELAQTGCPAVQGLLTNSVPSCMGRLGFGNAQR